LIVGTPKIEKWKDPIGKDGILGSNMVTTQTSEGIRNVDSCVARKLQDQRGFQNKDAEGGIMGER